MFMKCEYGKKFHGYEKYTNTIEKLLNNYCKKYDYEFSISDGFGREISYSILDGYSIITQIKYNYEYHRWLFYQFEFKIDIENGYDRIKVPVIHFANDGYIECDESKLKELFKEREKLLESYRNKSQEIKDIKNKLRKYSEILCAGFDKTIGE